MFTARFKPVHPDQRLRDLTRELRDLGREEPGPERARRLATFAREAHALRQLNMAMHAAGLCLEDDPDDPALLVAAYLDEEAEAEDRMRSLSDLGDLARYVDRPDVVALAGERLEAEARDWLEEADAPALRHRLRALGSILPRRQLDELRDEFEERP